MCVNHLIRVIRLTDKVGIQTLPAEHPLPVFQFLWHMRCPGSAGAGGACPNRTLHQH